MLTSTQSQLLTLPTQSRWHGNSENMVNTSQELIANAYAIAVNAHMGTDRKTTEAYVNHPLRIAQRIQQAGYSPEHVAIALLHDVVEDTAVTFADLVLMGFGAFTVSGVDSVTKREGETYPDAVLRASKHEAGSIVKLADNLDNSSPEQLAPFTAEKRAKQERKYAPARTTLLIAITGGMILDPTAVFTQSYRVSKAH